jgi:hypothetical protein
MDDGDEFDVAYRRIVRSNPWHMAGGAVDDAMAALGACILQVTAGIFNGLDAAIDQGGGWLLRHPWTFALTLGALAGLAYAVALH